MLVDILYEVLIFPHVNDKQLSNSGNFLCVSSFHIKILKVYWHSYEFYRGICCCCWFHGCPIWILYRLEKYTQNSM